MPSQPPSLKKASILTDVLLFFLQKNSTPLAILGLMLLGKRSPPPPHQVNQDAYHRCIHQWKLKRGNRYPEYEKRAEHHCRWKAASP